MRKEKEKARERGFIAATEMNMEELSAKLEEEFETEIGFMGITESMLPDDIIRNIFEYTPIHWMIQDVDCKNAFIQAQPDDDTDEEKFEDASSGSIRK